MLRSLRKQAGKTQAEVSTASGIQRPIVARIERGTHEARLSTVVRYLDALGLRLVLHVERDVGAEP
jgi:transcriptional regulator with XRE-family HTH domain